MAAVVLLVLSLVRQRELLYSVNCLAGVISLTYAAIFDAFCPNF